MNFFDVILVGRSLQYVCYIAHLTFKEKLKIQGHHPFKLGFGFTTTCIMVVFETVMKSGANYSRNGGQNN